MKVKFDLRRAFTLIELMIVVLIIGILATIAVPQYRKSVETSKALDALSLIRAIANANQMYFLDRNVYTRGAITNACNTATCQSGANTSRCQLVACGYLAKRDWDSYGWRLCACDTLNCGYCPGGACGSGLIACADNLSSVSPYNNWRYYIYPTSCDAVGSTPGTDDCP